MLHKQIKEEIKQALLAKEPVRLSVVRGLAAAFTNELVAKRRKPDEWLSDDETLTVIRRIIKQHQDSIAQFTAGSRPDLVAEETAELKILKIYQPPEISREEIEKLTKKKIKELGLSNKKDAGKLVGAMMKELANRADGATVKKIVDTLLTN